MFCNDAITLRKGKIMKKKIFAVCSALLFVLAFAGCTAQVSSAKAQMISYNNADYFVCGSEGEASVLKECGLPEKLTADLAGKHIEYLKENENGFEITDKETDIELFEYAKMPNDNVYIVKIGDEYYAAIKHDASGYHSLTD